DGGQGGWIELQVAKRLALQTWHEDRCRERAVEQGGVRVGHLQRRSQQVALADRQIDAVAGRPLLADLLLFPGGIWRGTRDLVYAAHGGAFTKTEQTSVSGQDIGVQLAELQPDLVKGRIAGLGQC